MGQKMKAEKIEINLSSSLVLSDIFNFMGQCPLGVEVKLGIVTKNLYLFIGFIICQNYLQQLKTWQFDYYGRNNFSPNGPSSYNFLAVLSL